MSKANHVVLRLLAALLTLSGLIAVQAATPTPAAALCVTNEIGGDWRNIDTDTQSITRVVVDYCASKTECSGDICRTIHDCCTFVQPSGSCSPTDCVWDRQEVESMGNGWYRTIYYNGWSTKHFWIKTYEYYGRTYLRVWVYTDFHDGRTDYTVDEWMLK
jgi:hypothetical protein